MSGPSKSVVYNSIADEIINMGFSLENKGVQDWLKEKGIIKPDDTLIAFNDISKWNRTGAEVYSSVFSIQSHFEDLMLIAKAIVTLNPVNSLLSWGRRRELLHKYRIPVSNWLWSGEGLIIEPFYPLTSSKANDFSLILEIGFKLDNLGFKTLDYLDDIRCDNDGNPYYIDFGFDLGEPSEKVSHSARERLIREYPLRENEIIRFYETFTGFKEI